MKTGRNDPCPCGSGNKFKHCCLAAAVTAPDPTIMAVRRVRDELQDFFPRMQALVMEHYGASAFAEAWDAFTCSLEQPEGLTTDSRHLSVFFPWMFHVWSPDPHDDGGDRTALANVSPTQIYLQNRGRKCSAAVREYLQSCLDNPFSFFEVEDSLPGVWMRLRDVLTGQAHQVIERAASQSIQPGQLIFGLLVKTQGIMLLESTSSFALPPIDKLEVIALREHIGRGAACVDPAALREWDFELLALYHRLAEKILHPAAPILQTTDGEAMEFHSLRFDIDSAQECFDALKHLDVMSTDQEIMQSAEFDAAGKLLRAEISWVKRGNQMHEHWTCTRLGRIEIDGKRLRAETSSRERAVALRAIISKCLGSHARFRLDDVQTPEQMRATLAKAGIKSDIEHAAAMASPDVQAQLTALLMAHYDHWLRTAIPALNGQTPLQAAGDPNGREKVAALMREIELSRGPAGEPMDAAIIGHLREQLRL